MVDNLVGDLILIGATLYVVDKLTGEKKRIPDSAAKRRLLAENKELRAKLAKKRKPVAKKKSTRSKPRRKNKKGRYL
jgi:hypothetical protein